MFTYYGALIFHYGDGYAGQNGENEGERAAALSAANFSIPAK